AVLYLTGLDQREMYGQSYRVKDDITIADLAARTRHVVGKEIDVVRSQLSRNRVAILSGTAHFAGPNAIEVIDGDGRVRAVSAEKVVIATGTKPARPASLAFDGRTFMDSDGIINLERVPRSMVVAGAGVIGIEYASMFAALGTKVTVVEQRDRMLEFCDLEVVEALKYHLRDLAVTFRFGETVSSVEARPEVAIASLRSGKKIPADTVLYSAGRQGATDELKLEAAGLTADGRGRIPDRGAAHLCGRRRDRVPGARGHVHGAGPARRAPRMRRACAPRHVAAADRDLQPARDQLHREDGRPAHGRRLAVGGRRVPLRGAAPRADHRWLLRR